MNGKFYHFIMRIAKWILVAIIALLECNLLFGTEKRLIQNNRINKYE